jgi:hypothetical protein
VALGLAADDVVLGSAWRSTSPVKIHAALAADLALLTEALDLPTADVATSLSLLMAQAAVAVPSYAGLTLRMSVDGTVTEVSTLDGTGSDGSIATSLRFRLPGSAPAVRATEMAAPAVDIVLYAATPGAFVDLAADLAWLTARSLDMFVLDADHAHPGAAPGALSVSALSIVNQALGVLIGEGRSAEDASDELTLRADASGVARQHAAAQILDGLAARDAVLPPYEGRDLAGS